ncbi:MAG: hypothetical protein RJB24_180 [Candidatus Parcubacteria bacterium]|jgi:hypothetical protein
MTSNQTPKLRSHINWKLLQIIDLLDKMLRNNKDIKDRSELQKMYQLLRSQKHTIERHHRRYGQCGYKLYLTDAENQIIINLGFTLVKSKST